MPSGQDDIYVYGHAGDNTANSVFQTLVGSNDYGNKSTATNSTWSLTNWVEGSQYVVYHSIQITNGGAPLVVKSHPGISGYTYLNGIQILASAPTAPVITMQPASQSVVAGASATFSVTATGTAPLSYQWRLNGTNIAGGTAPSLTLTNIQTGQAGNYSVAVTNLVGFAISSNALLTVSFPPANVQVISTNATANSTVVVPIVLTANGNENALGFSLNFDSALLSYSSVVVGSGASGATLLLNTSQTSSGKLGVLLALPTGATFTAGSQEAVEVSFIAAIVTNSSSTTIGFGDIPVKRELSDAPGNTLPATYTDGSVYIASVSFEGDVSPRPGGNQSVTITDWVLLGRYAARLDYPTNSSEFQRADCAPRSTAGNGAITVSDWVQAGRYAAGLDPLTPVGGPDSETPLIRTLVGSGGT